MVSLIYRTLPEQKQEELQWLHEQKIFPAVEDYYDWIKEKTFSRFGVIVSPEQALTIKLRHNLVKQGEYFK
jgi:hypothetical protein